MSTPSSPASSHFPRLAACVLLVAPLLLTQTGCGDLFGPDQDPAKLEIHAGQDQSGVVHEPLPDKLVVRVLGNNGKPLEGISVAWKVVSGDGTLRDSLSTTDGAGLVNNTWTLGPDAEAEQLASATAGGLAPVVFNAQAQPGNVATLTVEPSQVVLDAIQATEQLAAVFRDHLENRLSAIPATWTVLDTTVVSLSSAGLVTARGAGHTQVMAQGMGLADTVEVHVEQVATALAIRPATPHLFGQADTLRVQPEAEDRNGYPVTDPEVHWQVLDSSVVTVTSAGTLLAGSQGTTALIAASGLAADTVDVVVRPGIESFTMEPATDQIRPGDSLHFAITITDSAGKVFTDLEPVWSSSDTSVATIDAAGWLRARRDGTVTITAQVGRALAQTTVEVFTDFTDPHLQIATSQYGMVSSAHPLATEVGVRVLAEGGNAVDAAVATAFALAVVEIGMSSIAGRASIMIRSPNGHFHGIDGLNQVPHSYTSGAPEGYDRAATPGAVAAWVKAAEEHGTWPLSRIVEPAARLADEGFPLRAREASRISGAAADLFQHPASREYFFKPDGSNYAAGEIFRREDLARVIRAVGQEGVEAFYSGWIADSMHVDMVANGGFITRTELASYQALPALTVQGDYRGYQLFSNFRPASGHAVVQALQMLEGFDMATAASTTTWASLIGQSMQLALADRRNSFGTEEESASVLTSKSYAAERAANIRYPGPGTPTTGSWNTQPANPTWQSATTGEEDREQTTRFTDEAARAVVALGEEDREHTTHLTVMDQYGGVVALTQSLGPSMGTRLAARGLGFLYATRLGSTPGTRPSSTIAPTIVMCPDGQIGYALGGAGDARIITAVIQVLSRLIDGGLPLDQAMAAPRVHPLDETSLRMETGSYGWSVAERQELEALGFTVSTSPGSYFGRVHAVAYDPATNRFLGVAEPRDEGGAAGPRN